ncbi:MAG: hypothetical protein AAF621_06385 [Pseudomonadota bacterium]
MHPPHIDLPPMLLASYFAGMVIMPHCKCSVALKGHQGEIARHAYKTSRDLALIQTKYEHKAYKKGCYVKIDELEEVDDSIVRLKVTGISRFTSTNILKVQNFKHNFLEVEYDYFKNDYDETKSILNLEEINPFLLNYMMAFLLDVGMHSEINGIDNLSMDKFLNSLIMVMPMRDIERDYLSELTTTKEKEDALSVILRDNEIGLTSNQIFH